MSYLIREMGVRNARIALKGFLIGMLGGAAIPLILAVFSIVFSPK